MGSTVADIFDDATGFLVAYLLLKPLTLLKLFIDTLVWSL